MKDRVENFLKVAKQRVLETEPTEVIWDFNDLFSDLRDLVTASKDQALLEKLNTEWEAIWNERKIRQWDENFLKAIAGEDRLRESKFESLQNSLKNVQGFGSAPRKAEGSRVTLSNTVSAPTWSTK